MRRRRGERSGSRAVVVAARSSHTCPCISSAARPPSPAPASHESGSHCGRVPPQVAAAAVLATGLGEHRAGAPAVPTQRSLRDEVPHVGRLYSDGERTSVRRACGEGEGRSAYAAGGGRGGFASSPRRGILSHKAVTVAARSRGGCKRPPPGGGQLIHCFDGHPRGRCSSGGRWCSWRGGGCPWMEEGADGRGWPWWLPARHPVAATVTGITLLVARSSFLGAPPPPRGRCAVPCRLCPREG